jgi:hypothetical protein
VRRLEVHGVATLGLREVSALALCRRPDGTRRLLAVGDEDFAVVSAEIDDTGAVARTWRHDLRPALRGTGIDLRSGSGWEGVAVDGDGTVVLLQEEQARLLVLAPDLSRLLNAIALTVPADDPVLNPAWGREPNSRGEGLLLLREGHVLIAKERAGPCLIEFGPPGHRPGGVTPDTVLAPHEPFQRPDAVRTELVPLAVWPLAAATAELLPTINDLALGPDGRVYAISAHTQLIARIETRLVPGERAGVRAAWRIGAGIPGGRAARPEGLAFLPSGRPVVGIDTGQRHDNLVVLQAFDDAGSSHGAYPART